MNELPVIDLSVCAKIFGIATGQTFQVSKGEYMAKGCVEIQKSHFRDKASLFPAASS